MRRAWLLLLPLPVLLLLAWQRRWLLWDGSRLFRLIRPASDNGDGTTNAPLYRPLWGKSGTYTPTLATEASDRPLMAYLSE